MSTVDASPLIWLAKIGRINLLQKLFGKVVIPEEVYREVVETGLREGLSDALAVKEGVDNGWIEVSGLNEKDIELYQKIVEHASEVHRGEAQAIVLARNRNALLLMDESCGRGLAETLGLRVRGTLYIVLFALREGMLDKGEAKEIMLQLVEKGFRVDPKLLARIFREIEAFASP